MSSRVALEKIKKYQIINTVDKFGCPEYQSFEEALETLDGYDTLFETIEKDLDKLEQYKATDEELGLEFLIFLKAAKYGFYKKNDNGTIRFVQGGDLYLSKLLELKKFIMRGTGEDVYFSSYGSTWALTREELENGE